MRLRDERRGRPAPALEEVIAEATAAATHLPFLVGWEELPPLTNVRVVECCFCFFAVDVEGMVSAPNAAYGAAYNGTYVFDKMCLYVAFI